MRGFAINYKIRKTTTNNRTGDNYSITVPRIIAKQFEDCFFRLSIVGSTIMFESGCKNSIDEEKNKFYIGGAPIVLR